MGKARRGSGRRGERGAAAVEFALICLPLLYLVFGTIQYGIYFYSSNTGTNAVSDVVRRMSVGDCQDATERKNLLMNRLSGATTSNASTITVTPTYAKADGTAATAPGVVGGSVQLSVTYNVLDMHFPFVPVPNSGTITKTVFGRIEDTTATVGGCS